MLLTFATEDDQSKFEYIYHQYKRLLLAKAYDVLKDRSLAEDAVSEAFLRAYKNLHKIGAPDAPPTIAFLVTITKNVAITMYHRQKRSTTIDIAEYEEADAFDLETFVATKDDMSQALKLIDGLKEELRAVFLLKYAHDLPHKEIARLLGITENNVTVRLHRAKTKLLKLVKDGQHE